MSGVSPVGIEYKSYVLRITMTLPEKGNLINPDLIRGISEGLDRAENEPECRCVVLEGMNGVFSHGMDFQSVMKEPETMDQVSGEFAGLLLRIRNFARPVIAFIQGTVKAGGLGLAAACDLVIASASSTFVLTEPVFGLVPAVILPFIAERTGMKKARALTLSVRTLKAEEALIAGIADEVAPDEEAARRLKEQLKRILSCDPAVTRILKEYTDGLEGKPLDDQCKLSVKLLSDLVSDPAKVQAIRGFMEGDRLPWSVKYSEKNHES
jgi:enoyl-CoA hydratase/carnithine racemase